jgi:hypothetical protein
MVDAVTLEIESFLNAEICRSYAKATVLDAGSASWDLRISSRF